MIRVKTIVLTAAAMIAFPAAAGNLLANGGFEQPGGVQRTQVSDGFIPGWTYASNGTGYEIYEDQSQDGLAAADGTHYVSFGHSGGYGGSLSQTRILTTGDTYRLALSTAEQQGVDPTQQFTVTIASDLSPFVSFTIGNLTDVFTRTTHDFLGGGDATITITDTTPAGDGGGSNLALDKVSLVDLTTGGTVPEPAMWAMMVGGFGLTGAVVRRRRATVAA